MKTTLTLPRAAFLALALGAVSTTATFAQTATTTPAPTCSACGGHHHGSVLTDAEKAQLKKAHEAALAADPTLKTEGDSLKQQFETLKGQGDSATKDQYQALHQQKEAFETKLHAAELKIDPTLAPIFAKLDAAPKHGHHCE